MTIQMNDKLPYRLSKLWDLYLNQREKGLKKESSKLLNEFILDLEQLDNSIIEDFVFSLTDLHRIEKHKIDFRLFEKIVFPTLIDAIKSNKLTANRRLAQFDQMLLPSNPLFKLLKKEIDYDKNYFETADFYKKEIYLNNSDSIAIDGLINRLAWGLNYAIHELPEYGLIWDINDFESELADFKKYLDLSIDKHIWNNVLTQWDFVLITWKDYLDHEKDYFNYQDYLRKNDLKYEQATAPNMRP